MEPEIRGIIEKYLDLCIEDSDLKLYISYFKGLERVGFIDSVKSAIIGRIHGSLRAYYLTMHIHDINKINMIELNKVFQRRLPEIITKLNILLNL